MISKPREARCRVQRIQFLQSETNKQQLERWIRDQFKSRAFNTCPDQTLQAITGKPLDIAFIPDATPSSVHTPIRSTPLELLIEKWPRSRGRIGCNWTGTSGYSYNLVLKDASNAPKRWLVPNARQSYKKWRLFSWGKSLHSLSIYSSPNRSGSDNSRSIGRVPQLRDFTSRPR